MPDICLKILQKSKKKKSKRQRNRNHETRLAGKCGELEGQQDRDIGQDTHLSGQRDGCHGHCHSRLGPGSQSPTRCVCGGSPRTSVVPGRLRALRAKNCRDSPGETRPHTVGQGLKQGAPGRRCWNSGGETSGSGQQTIPDDRSSLKSYMSEFLVPRLSTAVLGAPYSHPLKVLMCPGMPSALGPKSEDPLDTPPHSVSQA